MCVGLIVLASHFGWVATLLGPLLGALGSGRCVPALVHVADALLRDILFHPDALTELGPALAATASAPLPVIPYTQQLFVSLAALLREHSEDSRADAVVLATWPLLLRACSDALARRAIAARTLAATTGSAVLRARSLRLV
jgi:hypothetical protein